VNPFVASFATNLETPTKFGNIGTIN